MTQGISTLRFFIMPVAESDGCNVAVNHDLWIFRLSLLRIERLLVFSAARP